MNRSWGAGGRRGERRALLVGQAVAFLLASVSAGAVAVPQPAARLAPGAIPLSRGVQVFPDASSFTGSGPQQVGAMLEAIKTEEGEAMRTVGPGPQQLARRWEEGRLSPAERLATLLAGATYHDPVLLPAIAEALGGVDLKERQAAAVGLSWLIGTLPPDPTTIGSGPEPWRNMARFARALAEATRSRTLVAIWVDSYLQARSQPHRPGFAFIQDPHVCLRAIREIATPADLDELVALWPQVAEKDDRYLLVHTFEVVTAQPFVYVIPGERQPTGSFQYRDASKLITRWVGKFCGSVDGLAYLERRLADVGGAAASPEARWVQLLRTGRATAWPLAAEALTGYGAPAATFDVQLPGNPDNAKERGKVLAYFPVSGR